jgi:hypothetical protein
VKCQEILREHLTWDIYFMTYTYKRSYNHLHFCPQYFTWNHSAFSRVLIHWLRKLTLINLTECNASHIILSYCYLPVSCNWMVWFPWSWKPQMYFKHFHTSCQYMLRPTNRYSSTPKFRPVHLGNKY